MKTAVWVVVYFAMCFLLFTGWMFAFAQYAPYNGQEHAFSLTYLLNLFFLHVVMVPYYEFIQTETYSNALGHILYGNLESISFWGFTVLGVLIYVLGIVQIYYPDKVYFFLRRWQFQNAELSDEGRTVTVIGGMIICIIGIGVMSGLILYLIK